MYIIKVMGRLNDLITFHNDVVSEGTGDASRSAKNPEGRPVEYTNATLGSC